MQQPSMEFAKLLFPSANPPAASFRPSPPLASGRLGANLVQSGMKRTQDTNWMRPNAELAANIPESAYDMGSNFNPGLYLS